MNNNEKIPIILDTDICDDIDDLYNLMVCILHPKIELKAVTTVYSDVLKKCRFISKIFRLMGVKNVPIGMGTRISRTRIEKAQFIPNYEKLICYDKFVKPEDPEMSINNFPSAQEVLKKVLDETTEKINIVCIGALSNIGELLGYYPIPEEKIKLISIMGGEIEAQMAEHNINCDPEAAQVVLAYGLPVFMGTFHQSKNITFPEDKLTEYFPDPKNNVVHKIFRECHNLWWGTDPYIYDLAPLYYLINPELYETAECRVNVELEGKWTRGYTIADYGPSNKNVKYTKKINHQAIIDKTIALFNKR